MTIREMRIDEYDSLIELWQKAGLDHRPEGRDTRENIQKDIARPDTFLLVAEIDGNIAGSILATHDGRKGWINRLAVDPDYRRKGIALKLVEEAQKSLYGLGIGIISCLIEDRNVASMKAFQKMGFVKMPDVIYFSKKKSPWV
ncbi:MAG: GNAT family N-acetyltransferase [Candidatus Eremiobacteraeota bacterium]|nr:GNAT family N-acetyltransferase [Candidatus Eremiobacteraeota bacterium]